MRASTPDYIAAHQDCLLHQPASVNITATRTHAQKHEKRARGAMNQEIVDTPAIMNLL